MIVLLIRDNQKIILTPVLVMALMFDLFGCTHPVRHLVFQPHKIPSIPPFPGGMADLERFWIETDQGDVEGWLFRGKDADSLHPGPAVLMAHGNRELIDFYLDRAQGYQRLGYTVLLGEYRGYGRSAGSPSRRRIASDFRQFYDRLVSLPMVDPKRIVFHGRSLFLSRTMPDADDQVKGRRLIDQGVPIL